MVCPASASRRRTSARRRDLPVLVCDTSPLQYLHQLGLLEALNALAERTIIPPAVVTELEQGRALGLSVPEVSALDWVSVRSPLSERAVPLVASLGPGETEVLMLGLECPGTVLVLDDSLARKYAAALGLRLTGTLGLLLDCKRAGLVSAVAPLLDQLEALGFRLATDTRAVVLGMADKG